MARSSKRSSFDPRQARGSMFQDETSAAAGQGESPSEKAEPKKGYTVAQVAGLIKQVLADHTPMPIRVVGEISNFSFRTHAFFSLKDAQASLRCVCFATAYRRLNFSPSDGMQVVASGRLDYFPGQGNIQLYVDRIEPVGQGGWELQLRRLMQELRELGYFDEDRKKPLPTYPQTIAVVTSRTGAAVQDVINTAKRRWAGCRLLVVDVRVQGAEAAPEIAAAIDALSRHGLKWGVEAMLLTRGGGSIEDLWAFNERVVADAVYRCPLPIVAAIGHETDTTIAELVADRRASTPTQAAMMLVPDRQAMQQHLDQVSQRSTLLIQRTLRQHQQYLESLASRPLFIRPQQSLVAWRQELDRLAVALRATLPHRAQIVRQQWVLLKQRWDSLLPMRVQRQAEQLTALERHLESLHPARVLDRGYSYTLGPDGQVLQDPAMVKSGDAIVSVLAKGRLATIVPPPSSPPSSPASFPLSSSSRSPSLASVQQPEAKGPQPSASAGAGEIGVSKKRSAKSKRSADDDQPGLF